MNNPYQPLQASNYSELAELGWHLLQNATHGDLPRWTQALDRLTEGDGCKQLDRQAPRLGNPVDDAVSLRKHLVALHPWRKGPLELGGVMIDTEWRSDLKWERIRPHLDLNEKNILDIGCGNGYFGLRMLAAGANLVVGIDPTLVFVMQWLAMQKLAPGLNNFVLPMGIEDLPKNTPGFDCVFSMGVLYHRRKPVEHLQQLKELTRPGGQIVLETLVLEGEGRDTLEPPGRYARMRNVHTIPSLMVLHDWLGQAGLHDVQVLDKSKTTTDEQRSTDWMTFESLRECLDEDNPLVTIEGHPVPVRAALLVQVEA